ncbi:hypothetical protein [Kitasatospora sp. NPDC057015]|uniref:hypothetical protein n=1 Tax=Kitasatospora sp. NPDC057015 TaxID=3346001 RepID=UPI003636F4FB
MNAASAVPGGTGTLFGLAGLLLLLAVLAHLAARRVGGWAAVRRGLRREAAATAAAFAAPVRAQLRYRRHVRLLVRLLGDKAGWADAERAALGAGRVPGVQPYGVLLGRSVVGVLVACGPGTPPVPPQPWAPDDTDPRLWWIDRADAARAVTGARPAPLLAALGTDGRHAVLLDLAAGPAVTTVGGERGTARAVLQAVAAQLDARLPAGAVTVADGVHPRHTGPDVADALAKADRAATGGAPAFAVCVEAPDAVRPAGGARLLALGGARGSARLLTADRAGLRVLGTGLLVDAVPLARATARSLPLLPPYPAHDAGPADDGDLAEPEFGADGFADRDGPAQAVLPGLSAIGATVQAPPPALTPAAPKPAAEPEPDPEPVAVPALGADPAEEGGAATTGSPGLPGRSARGAAVKVGAPAPVAPVAAAEPAAEEAEPAGRADGGVTAGPPPLVFGRVTVPSAPLAPGAPSLAPAPTTRPRFVQRPAGEAGQGEEPATDPAAPVEADRPAGPQVPAGPAAPASGDSTPEVPAIPATPAIPGVRGRLRLPRPEALAGDDGTFGPVRAPATPDTGDGPGPLNGPAAPGAPRAVPVDDDLAEPAPEAGGSGPGVSAAVPS